MLSSYHKKTEKRVKEQDIIFLPELMIRWSYLYYIKIIKEINNNKIIPYTVNRTSLNEIDNLKYYIIDKIPIATWNLSHFLLFFKFICFRKKSVINIEKNKKYYQDIQIYPKKLHELDICTRKNINNIAPIFACTLYYYTRNQKDILDINSIRIYMAALKNDKNIHRELEYANVNITSMPDKDIFYNDSLYDESNINGQKINIKIIEKRLAEFKEQGITDKYKLAELLDDYFPGSLSHHDLGKLLHAHPEREIKHESYKKNRATIKSIY